MIFLLWVFILMILEIFIIAIGFLVGVKALRAYDNWKYYQDNPQGKD